MNDEENPSLFTRIFGVLLFVSMAIFGPIWFFVSITASISALIDSQAVITFNKGAMYMLGGGISASFFSVGAVYFILYSRKVPEKIEPILIKGVIVGLLIMFIFPQIAHFSISKIIEKRKYIVCEAVSYRWLMYKNYAYTKSQEECAELVNQKEITNRY